MANFTLVSSIVFQQTPRRAQLGITTKVATTRCGGDQNGANLRSASYVANFLNQYTNRTVPGYRHVLGMAHTNAVITVNSSTASRKGEYFWAELGADNSSSPVWLGVTNTAVLAGGRADNSDLVRTNTGHLFLVQSPEAFTHDADGNLTADGRWTYTWNGENRLIALETTSGAVAAGKPAQRLEFTYDHQGRRIQKKVYAWDTDHWSLTSDSRFLYDGWNLIGIFDALNSQPPTLNRSFTWGLDLSGSEQGAGGVGGLLLTTDHGHLTTGFACYDGNGNVMALVDAATGMTTAQYEYGPFGEVLRATGPMAKANPFRFSTKYQDDETDLLYYGYRFLDAALGRWASRDLSAELEGPNLYHFCSNNPTARIDVNGLATFDSTVTAGLFNVYGFDKTDTIIVGYKQAWGANAKGPIKVMTNDLWPLDSGSALGKAECLLKKLGFTLPKPRNGVHLGSMPPGISWGYTVIWKPSTFGSIHATSIIEYSLTSNFQCKLSQQLIVTLYHEMQGHNINLKPDGAAFDATYEAPVINAWNKAYNRKSSYSGGCCWRSGDPVWTLLEEYCCECDIPLK